MTLSEKPIPSRAASQQISKSGAKRHTAGMSITSMGMNQDLTSLEASDKHISD